MELKENYFVSIKFLLKERTGFRLGPNQMFSVHTAPEKFENETIPAHFGFMFDKNLVREIT